MAPLALVTGGTGTLGRQVAARLRAAGYAVRVLSRSPAPAQAEPGSWVQGDLVRDAGVDAAVAGCAVIVHCATGARGDVTAAANLVRAARDAGAPHLVYISIVGIDRVPLGYYRSKLAVEGLVTGARLPWTILRATQFHNLLVRLFSAQRRLPVLLSPAGVSFQPIDAGEVAGRLVELVAAGPSGRAEDIGGPEIRTAADLAHSYVRATGRPRRVRAVRIPGRVARGYRAGGHLAPGHEYGRVTFEQFLATHPLA
jgi:uncharacterized protein YbjT (DUF2867 family)